MDCKPTYGNAQHYAGAVEMNHWAAAENERFDTIVKPLMDAFTMLDDGTSVASGVTGMAAFGHTPGHMVYMLESDGAQLMLGADFANHYVWSLGYPDWEVRFDMDKAAAAATQAHALGGHLDAQPDRTAAAPHRDAAERCRGLRVRDCCGRQRFERRHTRADP